MKTKLIITPTEQLIVSDEEIKENDLCFLQSKTKGFPDAIFLQDSESVKLNNSTVNIFKIIAGRPTLPQLLQSNIDQVLVEREQQKVEDLATTYFHEKMDKSEGFEFTFGWRKRFKEIFNLAKLEQKEKLYTKQQVEKAIEFGLQYVFDQRYVLEYNRDKDMFLHSLTPSQTYDCEVVVTGNECKIIKIN